ncbi:DEAD/DEAH box helicase [Catalinimonas niigatensis]|uniref:DEAD/DEAH box helicase n=1 Tax=Catalinimonas niigatensis TaxID=1397264 RepID=UPI002665A92E|nr:DEAD/DEAH box helicase [Catalinimonas niigatensis]WPP48824.1 DEAD/DEAH box helicase [Catalinimonas niigatensis]
MIKQFGFTWWGKQWLNALSNIDYSNRLPRGKSYARNSKAHDIKIKGTDISALVDGSQPRPYKVSVYLPAFSKAEQQEVMAIISENLVFLSSLLSRKLPPDLAHVLERRHIQLFPRSWNDMKAHCSCPDYAMPCKHIAAVIYLIANEIDKNPFLVFEMHGQDLLKMLEAKGFGTSQPLENEIPSIPRIVKSLSVEPESSDKIQQEMPILDFAAIPDCHQELLSLLSPNPLFYPGKDFKDILDKHLKRCGKEAKKELGSVMKDKEETTSALHPASIKQLHILLDRQLHVQSIQFETTEGERAFTTGKTHPVASLFHWLESIHTERLAEFAPAVQALSLAHRLSLALVRQGAVIPQIYQLEPYFHTIRWLPAYLRQEVKKTAEGLAEALPPGILQVSTGSDKSLYFSQEDQARYLLSAFLNYLIHHASADKYDSRDDVHLAFFEGKTLSSAGFEEKELPVTIYLWLKHFYLTEKNVVPLIKIVEEEPDFLIELWVEDKKSDNGPLALEAIFAEESFADMRMEFLQDLAVLLHYFPQLTPLISSRGKESLKVDGEDFAGILFQILPVIRLLNITVLLPKSLHRLIRPQLSMQLDAEEKGIEKHFLSMEELLRYQWKVALGDQHISPEEFAQLVKGASGIVKLRDQYVHLDSEEVRKLLDKLENPPTLKGNELMQIALTESFDGARVQMTPKLRKLLRSLLEPEAVTLPQGLDAQLRPYQLRGFAWMYKNSRIGFGSIIADDMGLGKTLQVIATLLKFKEEGYLDKKKALVVVPTTLLTNWWKEITRFAQTLQPYIYHGSKRKLPENGFDILLTTYGIARSDQKDLAKQKWYTLVIDEAQNIKNPGTAQTKALKKIKADVRIAMSGTPVENRLSEYWSIMDFSNKGYLGSQKNFQKDFAYPIEVEQDQERLQHFQKATSPFILRRLKSDKSIISDLPEKVSTDEYCQLSKEQAALYQNVVDEVMKQMEEKVGIERQGLVFKLIIALKQVCNHPVHYLKRGKPAPDLSGKSNRLLELLHTIYSNREKVLIFTQFREMGELLQQIISAEFHTEALFLHGGCSRKQRDSMVDDFQQNPAVKTMILSLKAGGTGLNLTAASRVIHYDLWWNPAVEAQATDRAYRIGQKRQVFVHRLLTQATFEEKINRMLQEKRELADMAVSRGEQWLGELPDKELKELFALT